MIEKKKMIMKMKKKMMMMMMNMNIKMKMDPKMMMIMTMIMMMMMMVMVMMVMMMSMMLMIRMMKMKMKMLGIVKELSTTAKNIASKRSKCMNMISWTLDFRLHQYIELGMLGLSIVYIYRKNIQHNRNFTCDFLIICTKTYRFCDSVFVFRSKV